VEHVQREVLHHAARAPAPAGPEPRRHQRLQRATGGILFVPAAAPAAPATPQDQRELQCHQEHEESGARRRDGDPHGPPAPAAAVPGEDRRVGPGDVELERAVDADAAALVAEVGGARQDAALARGHGHAGARHDAAEDEAVGGVELGAAPAEEGVVGHEHAAEGLTVRAHVEELGVGEAGRRVGDAVAEAADGEIGAQAADAGLPQCQRRVSPGARRVVDPRRVAAPARERPRRGQRARAVAARGHDVEAPVLRRGFDGLCRRVVAEAADGGRRPFEDAADEAVPDGGVDKAEVSGDVEAAPAPAVELPAVEHAADAVPAGGQRPERRAHVDPLGPAAVPVPGQVPPAHVDVARALAGRTHGAEEVLPAGQRGERVRGRVRLLARVVAAGRRAVEVDQQRRRRRRQQRAHYGGGVRLGQRERGQRGRRRAGPPRREQQEEGGQQEEEEGGMEVEVEPARRRHGSARRQRVGRRRRRGSGRREDMVRQQPRRAWGGTGVSGRVRWWIWWPACSALLCSATQLNCSLLSLLSLLRRGIRRAWRPSTISIRGGMGKSFVHLIP